MASDWGIPDPAEYCIEDLSKVLERKLVKVVEMVQLLQDSKDGRARTSNDCVLLGDVLNFGHDPSGLGHLI
jgi:hypothetical protein